MAFPIVVPSSPREPWFDKTWICTISGCFHVNLSFFASVDLHQRIFNDPSRYPIFAFLKKKLPLWRGPGPLFEQSQIPSPKDCLVSSLIEIGLLVIRRFFIMFSVFLIFCYYLPLGKGVVLHLNNSESLLPNDDLCQLWLQLAQQVWRRNWYANV
jgi:hypothetical protein